MKNKRFLVALMSIFMMSLVVLTSCETTDYRATVHGYVLSDPTYQDPVQGVNVTLRVRSADDVPDYIAITDSTGYYRINFDVGFTEKDGHFLPNNVVEIELRFSYGDRTYNLTDIRTTPGSMVMIPPVYLSQFQGGSGGGGGK